MFVLHYRGMIDFVVSYCAPLPLSRDTVSGMCYSRRLNEEFTWVHTPAVSKEVTECRMFAQSASDRLVSDEWTFAIHSLQVAAKNQRSSLDGSWREERLVTGKYVTTHWHRLVGTGHRPLLFPPRSGHFLCLPLPTSPSPIVRWCPLLKTQKPANTILRNPNTKLISSASIFYIKRAHLRQVALYKCSHYYYYY